MKDYTWILLSINLAFCIWSAIISYDLHEVASEIRQLRLQLYSTEDNDE